MVRYAGRRRSRAAVSCTRRAISVGRARAFPRGKRQRTEGGDGRGTGAEENASTIRFVSYNIRNGRNGGLEAALRAMAQANVDLGVFQETKLTDDIYTRVSSGYRVIATNAPSEHQGGVALFYRDSDQHQVEALQTFGPNVVSFQLASGKRRWCVVGCYIPPTCTTTIEHVTQAIAQCPAKAELVVAGDLNVDLTDPEGSERDETIAAAIADEGLEDMSLHFFRRRGKRDGRTWTMARQGRMITSKTDYVLGTDRRAFRNVQTRDPRCNSDHYMVVANLWPATVREHRRCLGERKRFPLKPPKGGQQTEADKVFAELKAAIPKPEPREFRRNS